MVLILSRSTTWFMGYKAEAPVFEPTSGHGNTPEPDAFAAVDWPANGWRAVRSRHLGAVIRPVRLVGPRRGQRRQPIGGPGVVTAWVVLAMLPRGFELAARA